MPTRLHIGRRPQAARGAALLSALVSIAVLTAVAVDLAYTSRVSLQIAANARDELRAHYLARSGVTMGRLVLSFQQDLDKATSGMAGMAGAAGASGGAAGLPGLAAAAGGLPGLAGLLGGGAIPRVQLWNLVPIDQALTESLFSGSAASGSGSLFATPERKRPPAGPRLASEEQKAPAAGLGAGSFDARIDDEGRKVSAQLYGLIGTGDQKVRLRAQALYQLMCDSRWDPLFDREDEHGVRTTREDILVNLRDWVNDEAGSSSLAAGAGSTSAQCGLLVGQPPFAKNFGDKNRPYDRGDDRYKTKNRQMDSLDELYLVAGIGDAFMAAFGDSLTVYLKEGDKLNVNDTDKDMLVLKARMVAKPPSQPVLFDPEFGTRLAKLMREQTFMGMLAISTGQFVGLVASLGVQVDQSLLVGGAGTGAATASTNSPFTDKSNVFRIHATGKVGAVRAGIDAVVRFDDQNQKLPGEQIAAPGRIIHWREE